ncbi:MAG TPA: STAS domain-containing protein [Phycisphaerae bacterium]|nr:STAS domain-containing protein [Phycisphaerae bacterium]
MPPSGLVVSEIENVTIVSFRSASIIDLPSVEAIGRDLYTLVDEQAKRRIILDFSAVKFLSSQMLGVLIALQKKSKAIKGRVVLCGLRPELQKVFKITKLDKILEFAPDEGEALKRFDVVGQG